MATKTTNYNLTKPAYDENADIKVINDNMDIIDAKMKEIEDAGGGSTITIDNELSTTSENPVQNKVITTKINEFSSNFVKSANWETLFEDDNGVAQGNGIYFDMKGYQVFAIQVGGQSLIFVRLWTSVLQDISAGIPVLIYNGTMWIPANRIIRIDSYPDHWHIQQLADFDMAGNSYSDDRKVCAIYGVK